MNREEDINFALPKDTKKPIKVIGVGGGGCNATNEIFAQSGFAVVVDCILCNTDAAALHNSPVRKKVLLGKKLAKGYGTGTDPEMGKEAAEEALEDIKAILAEDAKVVFIAAGMGKGTGTGASPVIAKLAKEMGLLTIAVVTTPFLYEGESACEKAQKGLDKLKGIVDSLIVIDNEQIKKLYLDEEIPEALAKGSGVLTKAVLTISRIMVQNFKQNIDLNDAITVLKDSGTALMGSSVASGADCAKKALDMALSSPLSNQKSIKGARKALLLLLGKKATMRNLNYVSGRIQEEAGCKVDIILGSGETSEQSSEDLKEDFYLTLIATGFSRDTQTLTTKKKTIKKLVLNEDGSETEEYSTTYKLVEDQIKEKIAEGKKTQEESDKEQQEQAIKRIILDDDCPNLFNLEEEEG